MSSVGSGAAGAECSAEAEKGAGSSQAGGCLFRVYIKKGARFRYDLRLRQDLELLDLVAGVRLPLLNLVELHDRKLDLTFSGIVTRRGGQAVMLVVAEPLSNVLRGCDITAVVAELPVWAG